MNYIIFVLFTLVFLNIAGAEDQISLDEKLKKNLQAYPLPTPEQILTVGLKLQESAVGIIEQKAKPDCANQNGVKFEKEKVDLKNKCFICSVMNSENAQNYQLILGRTAKKEDQDFKSGLLAPNEMTFTYSGTNDQPLHGAFEPIHHLGDDFNGHTYGSKLQLTADYNWGSLSLEGGSDLYVSSYDVLINGKRYFQVTNDPSGKVLQEADEHTYLRLNTKYYLGDPQNKKEETAFENQYLKFGFGLEHDSDQGIGFFGARSHRELWHQMFNVRTNQYVNHFKDQTSLSANAKVGTENYRPVGKLGFCSEIEMGLSGNTTGEIKAEALIKAALDSGTLGGGSRKDPLFVINFEAGISEPIRKGSDPTIETDPTYNAPADGSIYLQNRNYSLIGNVKTAHASLGAELGGDTYKLSFDVVYEKNQWNDGDLIYVTSLKRKF